METKVQTIMFVDMQGYTKRSAKQTIDEMKLFHDELHQFVRQNIEKWSGVLVKTLGDGFLIRFDSPTMAVQCGMEMQKRLESRNANMMDPESIVHFRIGLNTGDIGIDEQGDVFGDPVNIASRIQTFAAANEVFISESTYLAMNQNEFKAADLGLQMFKNATREIRVYKILKHPAEGGPAIQGSSTSNQGNAPAKPPFWQSPFFKGMAGVICGVFVLLFLQKGLNLAKRQGQPVIFPPTGSGGPGKFPSRNPGLPLILPPISSEKPANPTPPPSVSPENNPDNDADSDEDLDLLSMNTDNPKGKIPPKVREGINKLKELRAAKKYDEAIKIAEGQLENVKKRNQPKANVRFYLLLAKLCNENNQPQKSQAYLSEALANLPPNSPQRHKVEAFVDQLKRKTEKK